MIADLTTAIYKAHFAVVVLGRMVDEGLTDAVAPLMRQLAPELAVRLPRGLVTKGAPPAVIREAVSVAVWELPLALNGTLEDDDGRAGFARVCRAGGLGPPRDGSDWFSIYRGTCRLGADEAARGHYWTTSFDAAALYAMRHADDDLTGATVIKAEVRREDIRAHLTTAVESVMIPAEPPTVAEVYDRKALILGQGLNEARKTGLLREGAGDFGSWPAAHRASLIARARAATAAALYG